MKRVVDAIERVTAVLFFAGCALHRWDPRFFIADSDGPVHLIRHTRIARIRTFIPSR
jgi:hypothetical protein